MAEGGRDAAERAYEAYVKSNKQSEYANPSSAGGADDDA